MGFCQALTLLLVAAKLFGAVDWPWLAVASPTLAALAVRLCLVLPDFVDQVRFERRLTEAIERAPKSASVHRRT